MSERFSSPRSSRRRSRIIGLAGWRCRLTIDSPAEDKGASQPLQSWDLPYAEEALSEVTVFLRKTTPEIRWTTPAGPGDFAPLFTSPEGKRFDAVGDASVGLYTDSVFGGGPALEVGRGTLRVLHPERWPLYLELAMTWLMLREAAIVGLHAATCAVDGTGLVLVGSSGCGKSTLACALTAQGADFHGDETLFFQREQACLYAQTKTLGLRPAGLTLLDCPPPGDWYMAKPDDPKLSAPLPTPLHPFPQKHALFFFLDGFAPSPSLEPMPGGEAIRRLVRGMGHGDPSLLARLEAAAEVVTCFPVWRLVVGPPDATAHLLLSYALLSYAKRHEWLKKS